nr:reverse transcriptase domain-containing protein [Tanacetum cinerariifolium]
HASEKMAWPICELSFGMHMRIWHGICDMNYARYDPPQMIVIVGMTGLFARLIEEFGFALHRGMSLRRRNDLLLFARLIEEFGFALHRGGASRGTEGEMDVRRMKEEVDTDFLLDAHSRTGPAESSGSCESKVYTKSKEEHELHLKINLKLMKKDKCHVKPNKKKREGDCLYDVTTRDSCEERHDSHYGLRRDRDIRTLIMQKAHATKYYVRPGVTEIGESKMIGLELEQETTKVIVIKERLKEPKIVKRVKLIVEMKLLEFSVGDHGMMKVSPWKGVVRFSKKGELAPSDEFSLPEQLPTANEDKFPLLIQSDAIAEELCAAAKVKE